jgi:hypothetical protein
VKGVLLLAALLAGCSGPLRTADGRVILMVCVNARVGVVLSRNPLVGSINHVLCDSVRLDTLPAGVE